MRRRISVIAGLLSLLFISGLTAASPLIAAPHTAMASTPSVVVVSMTLGGGEPSGAPGYAPDSITVVIGVNNTVEWTNNDTVGHTVTSESGNGSISSGHVNPGASFTYTFTTPGTYDYYCTYHSWMLGTVVVKAAVTPAPEFPVASLAVILFAVIAAAIVVAPRLRPTSL
jgi:plastocyanin